MAVLRFKMSKTSLTEEMSHYNKAMWQKRQGNGVKNPD